MIENNKELEMKVKKKTAQLRGSSVGRTKSQNDSKLEQKAA